MSASIASAAYAENPKDSSPPNTFGKAASRLGQEGLMGDHASNPPDLTPDKPGREGIGNVAVITLAIYPAFCVHRDQLIPCVNRDLSYFFHLIQAQAMMLDDSYSCKVVKPYLVGVFAQYSGLPVFVTLKGYLFKPDLNILQRFLFFQPVGDAILYKFV